MRLVRKISLAKWKATLSQESGYYSADAITSCLRTQGNTLSLWRADDQRELDMSLMALSSSLTRLDKIEYIVLESSDIELSELKLVSSRMDTAAINASELHCDIVELDHAALGRVASLVKACVSRNEFQQLNKKSLKDILLDGIKKGEIVEGDLDIKLREDLGLVPKS